MSRPGDTAAILRLDDSFTTDRVYRVATGDLSFGLVEAPVDPPLRKDYGPLPTAPRPGRSVEYAAIDESGSLIGYASAAYEEWNRRVILWELCVAPGGRRQGAGRALIDSVVRFARTVGARQVLAETQNVNYPAVRFYVRCGFRLAGLDTDFYDPEGPGRREVALFLVLGVEDGKAPE
ncbi:MAG: GNAT family N-acetyltransferase [Bacillota bacterium]